MSLDRRGPSSVAELRDAATETTATLAVNSQTDVAVSARLPDG